MQFKFEQETIEQLQAALNNLEKEGHRNFRIKLRDEWLGMDASLLDKYPRGYIIIKIFSENKCVQEFNVCSIKNDFASLSEAIRQINRHINA